MFFFLLQFLRHISWLTGWLLKMVYTVDAAHVADEGVDQGDHASLPRRALPHQNTQEQTNNTSSSYRDCSQIFQYFPVY